MFPLGLALLSGLTWGSADFVGGVMSKRLPTATVMVVSQTAGLALTAGLVVVIGEPRPEARFLVYGGLGGLTGAVGLASLYKGLAVGRMSIVAPTASLSVAVPVIVGFTQGERPATLQLAGMAVASAGVLLAARTPGPPETASPGTGAARGIGYALVAALFLGLLITSLAAAGDAGPYWASLMIRLVSVPLFVLAAIATTRHTRRPTGRETGILAGVGVLDNGRQRDVRVRGTRGVADPRVGARLVVSGRDRAARPLVPA